MDDKFFFMIKISKKKNPHNIDYEMCIYCLPAKHAALSRKSKDWLSQNQENVSEWNDMLTVASVAQKSVFRHWHSLLEKCIIEIYSS
jgi:hypothetical protein